jgi:hypothetical protein
MPRFMRQYPIATKMRHRSRWTVAAVLVALSQSATCVSAQTLPLLNGTFDTSLTGWTWYPAQATPFRAGPDAEGNPASGYVELNAAANANSHVSQCVVLPPDTPWGVRPDFRYQHSAQMLSVLVAGFPNTGCAGPPLPNPKEAQRNIFDATTTWTTFSVRHLRLPPGSQSMRIGLGILCSSSVACWGKLDSIEATGVMIQDGFED